MGEYLDKLTASEEVVALGAIEKVMSYYRTVNGKKVKVSAHARKGDGPNHRADTKASMGEYKRQYDKTPDNPFGRSPEQLKRDREYTLEDSEDDDDTVKTPTRDLEENKRQEERKREAHNAKGAVGKALAHLKKKHKR
jgi:hypothetical protein